MALLLVCGFALGDGAGPADTGFAKLYQFSPSPDQLALSSHNDPGFVRRIKQHNPDFADNGDNPPQDIPASVAVCNQRPLARPVPGRPTAGFAHSAVSLRTHAPRAPPATIPVG